MKRALLVLLCVAAVVVGGRALLSSLRTTEEVLRDALLDEVAAFDEARPFSVLLHFADDYRDHSAGLDRGTLRSALLFAFQNRRMPDGTFRYRTEIDWERFIMAQDEGADTILTTFPLALKERSEKSEDVIWGLEVEATWMQRDGEWQISKSTHRTRAGKRPW